MSGIPSPSVGRNEPCPCGGGKKAKQCILLSRDTIHPQQVNVVPKPPATGHANLRCYLSRFNDCSYKVSREHTQGRAILEAIAGKQIVTSGDPGQELGEVSVRGIESMVAKVLCQRHNSSLSPLDLVGLRLAHASGKMSGLNNREIPTKEVQGFWVALNGHDLERWAMKNLLGMIASNAIRYHDKRVYDYYIPSEWIEVLVGQSSLVPPLGWYQRADPTDDTGFSTPFIADYGVKPLWDHQTASIVGVELRLLGKDYVLWLDSHGRPPRPDLGYLKYRCPTVYCRREAMVGIMTFGWQVGGAGAIEVTYSEQAPAAGHAINRRWHHYGETYDATAARYKKLIASDEEP